MTVPASSDQPARPADRVHLAVVGSSDASATERREAERVGRAAAEAGAVVVCGGLGGVMEAACMGAKGAGGFTVGILPGSDRAAANLYVDVAVPTGLGEARNALVVRTADAVVAVGGEYGTLSEIALALQAGIPVVGLGTWDLVRRGRPDRGMQRADTAHEAVTTAIGLARTRRA